MQSPPWNADIPSSGTKFTTAGMILFLVFCVGGGYWAYTAPLESAVVANGSFMAEGLNNVIQHLEGGLVEKILVKEGDKVKKGDVLIRLDKTKADAEYERISNRSIQLQILQMRLKWELNLGPSEKIKKSGRTFPKNKNWRKGLALQTYEDQVQELRAGIDNRQNQIKRLQKQKRIEKRKLTGILNVRKALKKRVKEMKRQVRKFKRLVKRGLATRARLDTLLLSLTQEEASLSSNFSEKEQSEARLQEIAESMLSVDLTARRELTKELRTTNNELSDVQERLAQAKDVANRILIKAPVDGVIVQLSLNTQGGVISPGQKLMEILPTNNKLYIQVYIPPNDRDDLWPSQKTTVQLSALPPRTTPMLQGVVTYISADLIKRGEDDAGTYSARIKLLPEDQVTALSLGAVSGMPSTVFIKTGSQTFWLYITQAIRESWRGAFTER